MSDYQPGDVCIATVRRVPNMRVMCRIDHWVTGVRVGGEVVHRGGDLTDIRRLIVLDLYDVSEHDLVPPTASVVRLLRNTNSIAAAKIADQIEAQTKPPRIPEPGLYGVVSTEDPDGLITYRTRFIEGWFGEDGAKNEWDELTNPVLVREGVKS